MKCPKWLLKTIFCCVLLLGGQGQAVAATDNPWSFVGFTRYRDALFIDKARLSRPSPGRVLVSACIEPAAGSLFRLKIGSEVPHYKKSLKKFKYLVMDVELSCPEDRMRFRKVRFLDAEGKVMHSGGDPGAPWKPVKPGSLWKDLEQAVCP